MFAKIVIVFHFVILMCFNTNGLNINQLYSYDSQNGNVLPKGDEKHDFVQLKKPVHLYTSTYDHVYVRFYKYFYI